MKNNRCPFCGKPFEKIYRIEQVVKKKRKKTKIKKVKIFEGFDYEKHKLVCKEYKKIMSL